MLKEMAGQAPLKPIACKVCGRMPIWGSTISTLDMKHFYCVYCPACQIGISKEIPYQDNSKEVQKIFDHWNRENAPALKGEPLANPQIPPPPGLREALAELIVELQAHLSRAYTDHWKAFREGQIDGVQQSEALRASLAGEGITPEDPPGHP